MTFGHLKGFFQKQAYKRQPGHAGSREETNFQRFGDSQALNRTFNLVLLLIFLPCEVEFDYFIYVGDSKRLSPHFNSPAQMAIEYRVFSRSVSAFFGISGKALTQLKPPP